MLSGIVFGSRFFLFLRHRPDHQLLEISPANFLGTHAAADYFAWQALTTQDETIRRTVMEEIADQQHHGEYFVLLPCLQSPISPGPYYYLVTSDWRELVWIPKEDFHVHHASYDCLSPDKYDVLDVNRKLYEHVLYDSSLLVTLRRSKAEGNINVPSKPPPGPASAFQNPLTDFKKTIKRDTHSFPVFKQDHLFETWYAAVNAVARAQDVAEVFDPDYKPAVGDSMSLFKLKNDLFTLLSPLVYSRTRVVPSFLHFLTHPMRKRS